MATRKFTGGKETVRNRLNELVQLANSIRSIVGDQFIRVQRNGTGVSLQLNIDAIPAHIPKVVRRAHWAKVYSVQAATFKAQLVDTSGNVINPTEILDVYVYAATTTGFTAAPPLLTATCPKLVAASYVRIEYRPACGAGLPEGWWLCGPDAVVTCT